MSTAPGGGSSQEPQARADAADLIGTYAGALAAGDAETALTTLSADAVFCSPFNTWRGRHLSSVFRARCHAFGDLLVTSAILGCDRAAISWDATVYGAQVEGVELISVSGDAVVRIDVFLRPASVLDVVHQAMTDAWPRSRPGPARGTSGNANPRTHGAVASVFGDESGTEHAQMKGRK